MNHILASTRVPTERACSFIALGEMAVALTSELKDYMPRIKCHLREAVRERPN